MNAGRFAVQHRRPGTGWRLACLQWSSADGADSYSLDGQFADSDTRVVELTNGMVIVVSERLAVEKRAAS